MTKDSDALFVLPWVELKESISIGDLKFLPWSTHRNCVKDPKLKKYIDDYAGIFAENCFSKEKMKQVDVTVILYENNIAVPSKVKEIVYKGINLLFFYFSLANTYNYINSNSLEVYPKPIQLDSKFYVIGPSRGRMIVDDFCNLLIIKPLNIASSDIESYYLNDKGLLLKAFGKLLEKSKFSTIVSRSLDFYKAAYEDNQNTHDYFKIGELISAIECLEGGGKRYEIIAALDNAFTSEFRKHSIKWVTGKKRTKMTVSFPAWAMDQMYTTRNKFRHKGSYKKLYLRVRREKIPMWDVGICLFQMLLINHLKRENLFKMELDEEGSLQSHFDSRINRCVFDAKKYREWQEKKKGK